MLTNKNKQKQKMYQTKKNNTLLQVTYIFIMTTLLALRIKQEKI